MTVENGSPQPQQTRIQLGPGRPAFTARTRLVIMLVFAAAVAAAVVTGVFLASSTKHATPHAVTIPVADRSASPALIRAAEAVGFHPNSVAGAGTVEGQPLQTPIPHAARGLLPVGSVAPPFTLRTPVGRQVSLASLRGKAVLLELFATWCPHCAAEAQHLKAMYAGLPHDRYAFLALNGDSEDAASVLAFHIWFGLPFPALLDPGTDPGTFHTPGAPGPVSSAYKLNVLPTFYVIDPHGRIAWSAVGEQPDALLLHQLRLAALSG
jgi:peroxiredoxin